MRWHVLDKLFMAGSGLEELVTGAGAEAEAEAAS